MFESLSYDSKTLRFSSQLHSKNYFVEIYFVQKTKEGGPENKFVANATSILPMADRVIAVHYEIFIEFT